MTNEVEYGLLAIIGDKAQELLQGQLSCDMQQVTTTHASIAALCNLKGRVVANMLVCQVAETYYLAIQQDLLGQVAQHLQKIAPLFKVTIKDISNRYSAIAATDKENISKLSAYFSISISANTFSSYQHDNNFAIYFAANKHNSKAVLAFISKDQAIEKSPHDINTWKIWCIQRGIVNLDRHTTDSFLPQTINLHHLHGLSFTKGCYLGQEVVARSYYRGKVKKQLAQASLRIDANQQTLFCNNGAKITTANQENIATIVNYAHIKDSNYFGLIMLKKEYDVIPNKQIQVNIDSNTSALLSVSAILDADFYS